MTHTTAPPPRTGQVAAPPKPRRGWRRRVLAAVAVVVLALGGGITVDALRVPGSDPAVAKLAEWARDHGLGRLVSGVEAWRYQHDQPSVGGTPLGGIPLVGGTELVGPALAPLAGGSALPGEGRWQTVVSARGRPAVEVAYLRPDSLHTSYVTGVMRIDPTLVAGRMHPGTRDPGGIWPESFSLSGAAGNVVAAFNGGFRLTDPSHPGYFSDGRTVAPLVRGEASLVLYVDGHADVGRWGSDVTMTPNVVSVRQNLVPLVTNGKVNPGCATGGEREWGDTVGQAAFIDRSAFGVTATGEQVYAAGPALSVCTLGAVLADAGVVRGMELDINPSWVDGVYFTRTATGAPVGHRLYPAEHTPATHYLAPSSRDWFAWTLRP